MVYIYTENFFWSARLKNGLKKLLGKGSRGPEAVFNSLTRGLHELQETFEVNAVPKSPAETAWVLSGVKTLHWVLAQKQKGVFKKVVAGPNVVVTPFEASNLVQNEAIDRLTVPSLWVKKWWASLTPKLDKKIVPWAAGVTDLGVLRKPGGKVLVFKKDVPEDLFTAVIFELQKKKLEYKVFSYGQAGQSYIDALRETDFIVYLNTSESQGLALQEAWMGNVPTLVWNRGLVTYGQYRFEDSTAGAPYLTTQSGAFFSGKEDFPEALHDFIKNLNQYSPRAYVQSTLTDKLSAEKFLAIANSHEEVS